MGVRIAAGFSAALVVGSVVVADPAGLSPFGPAKWAIVSVVGLLIGGSALWHGRQRLHRRSLIAWGVLLAMLSLATAFGGDVPTALLGQPDRHLGLITWLLFFALFCAGQQMTDPRHRRLVWRSVILATVAMGLWATIETTVGPLIDIQVDTSRLTGPFGSAAYLGAAACLLTPISAGGALEATSTRGWRAAAWIGTVGGTVALIGSGARAAWLGAATVTAIVLLATRPSGHRLRMIVAACAVAGVCAAPFIGDLVDRPSGQTSRLDEWTIAGRVVADHPLIGVGPEGYRIAVSDELDRNYEREYGRSRVLPDRAHSNVLDVALNGGLLAAAAYLALIVIVCRRALALVHGGRATDIGLGAALIAYVVQQLLLFPLAELDPIFWLLAGMTMATAPQRTQRPAARSHVRRASAVAVLALAPFALVAGSLDVAADRLARRAMADDLRAGAIDAAERAVALRPDELRYRMVAADVLSRRGTVADIQHAIEHTEAALDWSPHDPVAVDRHASLLLDRAGITGDPGDIALALRTWSELVARDPNRARWQLQFGRAAALAGKDALARACWVVAADLAPDDPTPGQLIAALDEL
jgi:O-antigen ligase/Flp pilus assembly protein TadD